MSLETPASPEPAPPPDEGTPPTPALVPEPSPPPDEATPPRRRFPSPRRSKPDGGESSAMRRLALALVVLLVVATPAFGDDVTKKHQVDTQDLEPAGPAGRAEAARAGAPQRGRRLHVAHPRAREQVGDVSLRLQTLEADLVAAPAAAERAERALTRSRTKRYGSSSSSTATSISTLDRRLVDIYESDAASTLDVFLGARNVQDALDQVQYLNESASRTSGSRAGRDAKAQVKAARAKTKTLRANVQGETAVISARTAQTRDVRDELVGAHERSVREQEQEARPTSRN